MSTFPTSKRSACDRCRSQKLRCPPRGHGTDSCTRCIRLSAWCVTSYPRPSGRVAKGGPQGAPQQLSQPELRPREPKEGERGQESLSTTTSLINETQQSSTSAPNLDAITAPSNTNSSGPSNRDERRITYDHSLSYSMPENDLDIFTSNHTGSALQDSSMILDCANQEESVGPLYHDFDDFSPLSLQAFMGTGGGNGEACAEVSKEAPQLQCDGFVNEPLPNILVCDTRLSNLNSDLSRQLQQCSAISEPQDNNHSTLGTTTPPGTGSGVASDPTSQEGPFSLDLFGDALGHLSEFITIIQSLNLERNIPSRGASSGTGRPSCRLGIIILLNLLSVYLQMVAVYDKLFHYLSKKSFSTSEGCDLGPQLAGLPVQYNNLQSKILIHAILRQFEIVERILGLPTEFRVTDKPEAYSGLFEDECTKSLLEVVGGGKWYQMGGSIYPLQTVSSLRDNIVKVQTFLDI